MPSTATAFSLRLRLHFKAARVGGVSNQSHSPLAEVSMADKKYSNERPRIGAELERMVKTRAGHCCEINNCNEHTYLEIHHIDHNRENNFLDNLILLCRKHHAMAHADKIDRKSLRIYTSKSEPETTAVNPLDIRAYSLIAQKFSEDDLISQMRSQSYMERLSTEYVDAIHSLPFIWQDPFSKFNNVELNQLNQQLLDACNNLSRILANKTFPPVGAGGYYEVPKEHEEDHYYKEIDALKAATDNVCMLYDSLLRAAVVAGIDC